LELGQHGIRVNSIHPGKIDVVKERDVRAVGVNPDAAAAPIRVPLGRSGLPVDVARLALFLASDESSCATGAEFVLDGGWTSGFRLDFFDQLADHMATPAPSARPLASLELIPYPLADHRERDVRGRSRRLASQERGTRCPTVPK